MTNKASTKESPIMPYADHTVTEYERCLLGAYIMGADIGARVNKDIFVSGAHKIIFQVIKNLKAAGVEPTLCILVSELEKGKQLEAAGGYAGVAALTDNVGSTANKSFYEAEVLEAYRGRAMWRAGVTLTEAANNHEPPDVVFPRTVAEYTETVTRTSTTDECDIDVDDLMKKEFPPEDWLVEGLITTGLTVLTGASKIGKSWMALQLVAALGNGGYFMGSLKARKGGVLYCALEDTPKRLQKRLRKQGIATIDGAHMQTRRRTPADLLAFLKANPHYRVVIIDTFQKMMGINDLNDYSQTVNGMSALKDIADGLSIAVIVIHHNRKGGDMDGDHMEAALGSTGINATADGTLTMRRKRGDPVATLAVTGRDVEDTAYTLAWDKDICSWAVTDREALKPALPEAQQQIIGLLESEARNWSAGEIVETIGKSAQAIGNILRHLKETGHIENPERGQWRAKSEYTNTHPLRESELVYSAEPAPAVAEHTGVPIEEPEIW